VTPTEALDRNKRTTTRFLDLMSAGDVDEAFTLLTEDCTWFSLSTRRHAPASEIYDALRWINSSALKAPIMQQLMFVTAEDDRVAVVSEGYAVTVGGVTYNNLYHFLFQFAGERIAHIWEFNDTAHSQQVFQRGPDGTVGLTSEAAGDAGAS
jgi:uncharacterized protein